VPLASNRPRAQEQIVPHFTPRPAWGFAVLLLLGGCGPFMPEGEEALHRSGQDVVGAGRHVAFADSVGGDAMLVGRTIVFSGAAAGSFLGAGEELHIDGRTGAGTLAAGGVLLIGATVERNLTVAGADVQLLERARILRNAYLAGGRVEQRGTVDGQLRIAAREVVLNGPVGGDVDVITERLTIGPRAVIGGSLRYRAEEGEVTIDPAARIEGGTAAVDVRPGSPIPGLAFDGARLLGFLLVGTVAVLLFARPARKAASALETDPLTGLGLGLLWLLFVPVVIFAAFVTVIGIPLAVTGAALYVIAFYLAPILPSLWLGRRLTGDRGTEGIAAAGAAGTAGAPAATGGTGAEGPARPAPITRASVRAFLFGGGLVGLAMLLPWVGFPARLIAISLGFGGAVLAVREHLRG
jgi:hypothetical protein